MIVKVIVDIASSQVDKIFDYKCKETGDEIIGRRVSVPFGNRSIEGYAISVTEKSSIAEDKLKFINHVIDDEQIIPNDSLALAVFMTKKYHIGMCDALRLMVPTEIRSGKVKALSFVFYELCDDYEEKIKDIRANATKQLMIISALKESGAVRKTILATKYSASAIKVLEDKGIIKSYREAFARTPYDNQQNEVAKDFTLTKEQTNAIDIISNTDNRSFLLHGVTGSGKTEVFLRIIEEEILKGKTAILLVPEIGLTPQMLSSLKSKFGKAVALIHSGLSSGEKFDEWQRLLSGEARVVVGARSAIFAPLKNIGVIIIDEEHEQSYVSENNPRYDAREVAEERRRLNSAKLISASATPSLISYKNAVEGNTTLIEMKERVNGNPLPKIKIVDMCSEIRNGNSDIFSTELKVRLEETINSGNQAMLFVNRRGFSSFILCKECGFIAKCPSCDVALVYHKDDETLKCHYCGNRYKAINVCPNCKSEYLKEGAVGTQKVVYELQKFFPNVKILRMDNDTTKNKDGHLKILNQFRSGEAQILVGTQMIAKGHDFPSVTLVGIIDADLSLYQSSYSAIEKTFELITQVAGRAGRAELQGVVVLQTYSPKHYVYKFAENYDYMGFYAKESNLRKVTAFPPFSKILRILVTSESEELAKSTIKVYYDNIKEIKQKHEDDFIYLSAMKSPISKIQNKYRFQILIRLECENADNIIDEIFTMLKNNKTKALTFVETNPQSLS
ncbi:MAG: primosomal protein N' [Clostridia bacterium]